MPPLPRGICSVCFVDVALRKGGLVREHRYLGGSAMPVCSGSGKPARVPSPGRRPGTPAKETETSEP